MMSWWWLSPDKINKCTAKSKRALAESYALQNDLMARFVNKQFSPTTVGTIKAFISDD